MTKQTSVGARGVSVAPQAASKPHAGADDDVVERIKRHPKYEQLARTRSSYGWMLTALMMLAYYGFILLVAFKKEWLSARMGEGVTTWGIPIGVFVIVFTVVITGIYVRRANGEFDELTADIRKDVLR